MARLNRLVVAGEPHLVCQSGHNRQPVFLAPEDQRLYLDALREVARVHGVAIHAYALLATECWLLATPQAVEGLGRMMQALGRRYVTAFNRRYARTGTLWEGRYRATVIESEPWFRRCMVFVEGAPAREQLAHEHAWADASPAPVSSAPHHLGSSTDPLIWDHAEFWALGNTPFEREAAYNLLLAQGLAEDEFREIENACKKGWPLGRPAFLERLAKENERRTLPLKRGRRRKNDNLSPI